MATKLVLTGARIARNLGGPSLLSSTLEVLTKALGEIDVIYYSPARDDVAIGSTYGVQVRRLPGRLQCVFWALVWFATRLRLGPSDVRQFLAAIRESEAVIDILGIRFSDKLGNQSLPGRLIKGTVYVTARLLGRPMIKYTCDMGPFALRWNRCVSRFYLNSCVDLILARSVTTKQRLEELGVSTPIRVSPDTAFLLSPTSSSFSQSLEGAVRPLIGFSVSHMAAKQFGDRSTYAQFMAQIADATARITEGRLLFIPNEYSDNAADDDLSVAHEVLEAMRAPDRATLFEGADWPGSDVKGVIAQCDAVISSRYHTIIASLSLGIPVFAIGWHAKYDGVLRLFGLEELVCSLEAPNVDSLVERVSIFWSDRDRIRATILDRLPNVREEIMAAAICVADWLREDRHR